MIGGTPPTSHATAPRRRRGTLRHAFRAASSPLLLPIWAAALAAMLSIAILAQTTTIPALHAPAWLRRAASHVENAWPALGTWSRALGRPSFFSGGMDAWFVLEEGRLARAAPDQESWDAMTRRLETAPETALLVRFDIAAARTGRFMPASQHTAIRVHEIFGKGFTAAQREHARRIAIEELGRSVATPAHIRRVVARGNAGLAEPVWLGLALNAATLAILVLATAATARLLAMPLAIGPARARRRLARGLCVACGYSRAGLEHHDPCPECGRQPT